MKIATLLTGLSDSQTRKLGRFVFMNPADSSEIFRSEVKTGSAKEGKGTRVRNDQFLTMGLQPITLNDGLIKENTATDATCPKSPVHPAGNKRFPKIPGGHQHPWKQPVTEIVSSENQET